MKRKIRTEPFLNGKKIYLRALEPADINENHYNWLNDAEITKYLEIRFYPQSLEKIKENLQTISGDGKYVFLAIIRKEDDAHIGNIKLGPINWLHRHAEIGLLIGEKTAWGKGYATEAIKLLTEYAFDKLNLHKLSAGYYKNNIGSHKAFERNGYAVEGIRREHCFCEGRYVDAILVGKLRWKCQPSR